MMSIHEDQSMQHSERTFGAIAAPVAPIGANCPTFCAGSLVLAFSGIKLLAAHAGLPFILAVVDDGQMLLIDGQTYTVVQRYAAPPASSPHDGQHNVVMRTVVFHPRDQIFAAAGDDRLCRVYRFSACTAGAPVLDGGAPCLVLEGHADYVRHVSFHPARQWLLSSGDDHCICLWKLNLGGAAICGREQVPVLKLIADTSSITCAEFCRSGTSVICGSAGGRIRLWSCGALTANWSTDSFVCQHEACRAHLGSGVRGVMFHPAREGCALSFGNDCTLRVWAFSPQNMVCQHALWGHTHYITCAIFAAPGVAISGSEDGTMRVFDLDEGQLLKTIRISISSDLAPAEGVGGGNRSATHIPILALQSLSTASCLDVDGNSNSGGGDDAGLGVATVAVGGPAGLYVCEVDVAGIVKACRSQPEICASDMRTATALHRGSFSAAADWLTFAALLAYALFLGLLWALSLVPGFLASMACSAPLAALPTLWRSYSVAPASPAGVGAAATTRRCLRLSVPLCLRRTPLARLFAVCGLGIAMHATAALLAAAMMLHGASGDGGEFHVVPMLLLAAGVALLGLSWRYYARGRRVEAAIKRMQRHNALLRRLESATRAKDPPGFDFLLRTAAECGRIDEEVEEDLQSEDGLAHGGGPGAEHRGLLERAY